MAPERRYHSEEKESYMSDTRHRCYIATVCLERNRWGTRVPSFAVSDWLDRFASDGFEGIELWEYHYTRADDAERRRLVSASPIPIYNTYASFDDDAAEAREASAAAIVEIRASGVKYNVGRDASRLGENRRNLIAWSEAVPSTCRLLCECHPGTALENVDDAAAFFADLDPDRFGVIVHVAGDVSRVEPWLAAMGARVQHVHVQMRGPDTDPSVPANRAPYVECFDALKAHDYSGTLAIEFSRGIGRDEDMELVYGNACADLAFCREALE